MNEYHQLVNEYLRIAQLGRACPLGGLAPMPCGPLPLAPQALIFSPHPDDECIIGGLALRLRNEAGVRVVNVAVTQGSNPARQEARLEELTAACHYLGFDLATIGQRGLEQITPKARQNNPEHWRAAVGMIADYLTIKQPRVIFFPHERDWNGTHIGTHWLVVDALQTLPPDFACFTVETEFWGAMDNPNLMVECSARDVGDLMAALSFHVGEVRRNPYHLRLPAWMQDNVRRGGELVGGQGAAAPDFNFATLYRLRRWHGGAWHNCLTRGVTLAGHESPAELFNLPVNPPPKS